MSGGIEGGKLVFRQEARELLDELETALLGLEEQPDDKELVGRVFRAMHTLKGSGSMFGFDDVAAFTHQIETYFDMVRSGKLPVTKELVDLTLASLDHIALMLGEKQRSDEEVSSDTETINSAFRRLVQEKSGEAPQPASAPYAPVDPNSDESEQTGTEAAYHIRFKPSKGVMLNGTNPLHLLDELRSMGEYRVTGHTELVPALDELDPEACYTYWDIDLVTSRAPEEIRDVFIFVEDDSEISITPLNTALETDATDAEEPVLLGDLLVKKGIVERGAVRRALNCQKHLGEMLVEMGEVSPSDLETALKEQKSINSRVSDQTSDSIRVSSEKLDVLAELVGQIVTAQSRLKRLCETSPDQELANIAEEMEKLSESLRDNTLGMRMIPIGTAFTRFKRLVRDLSGELGKEVQFVTDGGETELDKTVMERLSDPIMHIIRNSIDHGIETPDERRLSGKPGQGVVRLSASQSGGWIFIRITDDGRGIDKEAIRAAAVERGLITPDETPDKDMLRRLLVMPGFSTSRNVSSVSGRGVGMDVVNRCIDSLRGTVEVDSEPGTGTTVILRLPLTLAIIDGLLLSVADSYYIVPLSSVMECVDMSVEASRAAYRRRYVDIRGELVPYIRLRNLFLVPESTAFAEHLVIVDDGGDKIGIAVDQVVGEHQTVIKPLSRLCSGADFLSGATILGDGMPALILDIPGVARTARKELSTLPNAA